ncbi:CDP-glycerol glycerophosphotransferase family protein, partial [Candidatus Saccharibacteria bacterium]|nr:CDP-glycerol glycerophosphotransferase family protein [Candidatus Saccharibacteria bacterium]
MRKIQKILSSTTCFLKYLYFSKYCRVKKNSHPDTWLISERGTEARDNAYHFYKYLKKYHPDINVKYIITKDSPDRHKIAPRDRVDYGSKTHFILFLTAGKLISSHIMGCSPDASLFSRLDAAGKLKIMGQKIFLQHGIIKDDIPYLYKDRTNLDLFSCSAQAEYQFVLDNFGYDKDVVKCTGLARYDSLKNSVKKQILVMPTFRRQLNYVHNFKHTNFYQHWNSFLQNPELIKFLEKTETTLVFYPHYQLQKRIKDFSSVHPLIKIADSKHYDVQQLLNESKLLITDYSSVHFDFAYLNKP